MAHTKVDMKGDASIAITHVRRKNVIFRDVWIEEDFKKGVWAR